ncbi:MAG: M10 family metallopeptidase C-terminal domain-containing protein [Gammaproteobacteria bacterium]|nr:M10 family metallopeptidase C-terminal domain-containing protein [Gammaproteobacteria bacterium]
MAGGAGNDTLTGGLGIDTLSGGLGNDTYFVDVGDVLLESAGAGVDVVKSAADWTLGVEFENLRLIGTASVQATGNAVANTINGNVGDNLIAGAGGNDLLRGAAGNDTMDGGDGNDTVYGGAGDDSMLGGEGDDSIGGGNGADALQGGAGNDTLVGGDGFDFLGGGAGIDVLKGGRGADTLAGNDGADVFVFDTALSVNNIDTITDFVSGQDLLRLDDDVFTALSAGVALGAAQLLVAAGATSAHDADDRIIYNTASGALYYDADGAGGTAAVQFAQLGAGTHPGLTAEDFLVVA